MTMINYATRILRTGDAFSESNLKLRKAVSEFSSWLWGRIRSGDYEYSKGVGKEIGWIMYEDARFNHCIKFSHEGRWYSMRTGINTDMDTTYRFCEAIAGEEGSKLLEWLEKEIKTREEASAKLSSFKKEMIALSE